MDALAHKAAVGGAAVPVIALAVGGAAVLGRCVQTLVVQAGVLGAGIRVYALHIVGAAVGIDHGNALPAKTGVGGTNISVVTVAVSFATAGDGFVLARTVGQAFVRRASVLIITGRVILTAAAAGDGRKHTARIRVAGIGRARIIVAALEVRRHTLAIRCARIYRACTPVITRVVVLASAAIGDGFKHAARVRVAGIGRARIVVGTHEVRRHTLAIRCARIYRACTPVITRVVVLTSTAIGDGLIHAARARVAGIGRAGVIVAAFDSFLEAALLGITPLGGALVVIIAGIVHRDTGVVIAAVVRSA
jgi:hypothetical protein